LALKTKEKIQEIAKEHNSDLRNRDLLWVVPKDAPRWIELWLQLPEQPINIQMKAQESALVDQNLEISQQPQTQHRKIVLQQNQQGVDSGNDNKAVNNFV